MCAARVLVVRGVVNIVATFGIVTVVLVTLDFVTPVVVTVVIVYTVAASFVVAFVAFPVVVGRIGAVVAIVIVDTVHIFAAFVVGTVKIVP